MSDIVDFKLTLNDKEFSASIKNAGKLLETFGKTASNNSKKMSSLERSVVATGRSFSVLSVSLGKGANKMEDFAAGTELAGQSLRVIRENIAAINRSLSVFSGRVDQVSTKLGSLTNSLKKAQSELMDFADFADHAGRSAKGFSSDAAGMGNTTTSLNRRLSNTTKILDRWKGTTDKAADGLKNVRERMDDVIRGQSRLNGRILGGGGVGGGNAGGSGRGSGSGGGHDRGMFSGLRGNIFMLGEVGDAARLVTDVLFSWQKPIIEAAAEMQKMEILLQGLNKNAANPKASAANEMQFIIDTARSAPFAMRELTDSFVKFKSAGLDPLDGSWKTLIDSVARFGGNSELLNRAAVAIQQMSGKGVISMEELRQQLGEAVPTAMQAMADAAGVTMAQLTKQISTGTVSAKEGLRLLFIGLDAQNRGAAKSLMQAYTGALAQMQTSFTLFAKKVGDAGYLSSITNALKEAASFFNSSSGSQLAMGLGSGLSSVVDSLVSMAKWATVNQTLLIEIGKAIVAFVGFKLLRSSILGVVTAGSQMGSVLGSAVRATQAPFDLLSTAVTRFGRASRLGLGTAPSLLFAIRGGITAVKTAFSGLTAIIVANPIGAALTAVAVAVSGIIYVMSLLKDKTAETVEEIRKIPQAMNAASRAKIVAEIKDREQKLQGKEDTLKSIESGKTSPTALGVDVSSLRKEIESDKATLSRYKETVGMGDVAQKRQLATDVVNNRLQNIENTLNKNMAVYSSGDMAKNSQQRITIESNNKLSREEKNAQIREINEKDRNAQTAIYQQAAGEMQTVVSNLGKEVTNLVEGLKNPKLTESERSLMQAQLSGQSEAWKIAKERFEQMDSLAKSSSDSRKGIPGLDGTTTLGDSGAKTSSKLESGYLSEQKGKGSRQRVNADGSLMFDVENNPVVGDNQMKANIKIRKLLGEGIKLEQASAKDQAIISKWLADAKEKDSERAAAAAERASKKTASAAEKEARAQKKTADGYDKALEKSEQLIAQMGSGSKTVVSFRQTLDKTKESLVELSKASPSELISQESIDKAKENLAKLSSLSEDYIAMMNRRGAKQMASTWAPDSDAIIRAGSPDNREDDVIDFRERYKTSLDGLITLRDNAMKELEKDPTQGANIDYFNKRIQKLVASGNRALIEETGTATQKLAVGYEDVAGQIETAWSNAFSGMTDTITDFIMDGKASFSDFARSIVKDIASIIVKSQITAPIMNMMGMGANGAGGTGNVAGAILNQGVSLVKSGGNSNNATVNNGDKSIGQSAKETSAGISQMSTATENANSGLSGMVSSAWNSTKSFLGLGTATGNQTKAIGANILTMNNLSSVASGLTAVFASMGASSTSSKGRWLNFGMSMVSAATSVWAGSIASGAGGSGGSGTTQANGQNIPPIPKFEKGGIMGPNGVIPLKTYSKGGIATSPQLALFGEGKDNEAYVPLPDGRSIPVTMTGNVGGGGTIAPVAINISVNSDGSSSTSGSDADGKGWNDAAQRIKNIVLETITQEKRPGGSLNKNTNGNR
ncbi:tape measure protein [Klebsiella pneumoniae]|uniref:tape measure protein n=1 Tax=Klebsiella pneumoniae TaxID=573 RepID=UPI0010349391|nr:tape measure protein [Klebsiella pneumoniae]EKW9943679.1 tape measure protein [Klebsiella oxytoca]